MLETYIPLVLAVLALFRFERKVPLALIFFSVVMALTHGLISVVALPSIALVIFAGYGLVRFPKYKPICLIILFIIGIAVFLHVLPGFNNPRIIDQVQISPNSLSYSMYLNFDKAIFGLLLLTFIRTSKKPASPQWLKTSLICGGLSLTALVIGLSVGLIAWAPKLPEIFLVWALSNLFITCVAEEAFFRGFLQQQQQRLLRKRRIPPIVAVVMTSILFGLVHMAGGWLYVPLAMMMGFAYGYIYFKTNRLRYAIALHFGFNCVHFLLFSYPILLPG